MTKTVFKDDRCRKLYEAAAPTGHMVAFAWRESPKTLQNHWAKETKGMSEQEKDELLKTCLLAGEAQTKYRIEQKKAGKILYRPKGIAPWFNAGDWDNGIGSHAELKEQAKKKLCHCGHAYPCPKHFYDNLPAESFSVYVYNRMREICKRDNLHKLTPRESLDYIKAKLEEIVSR